MRFVDELGGWIPVVDESLATSVAGVFVAGDGGGVGGALVAEAEGSLAGLAAAHRLGRLDATQFARARQPIDRRLRRSAPLSGGPGCAIPHSAGPEFSGHPRDDCVPL